MLTADYVRTKYPGARCVLVNNGQIADDMRGIDIVDPAAMDSFGSQTPDVILLGGAGPEYSHLTLSRVCEWMSAGVPVVAMHRSAAWNTAEGLRVDTGCTSSARRNLRPQGNRRRQAGAHRISDGRRAPGVEPDEMYMVGDDLNNDVLAASAVGMTGVLVRTGKFQQSVLDRWATDEFAMQPNHVIDSVADLPELLGLV